FRYARMGGYRGPAGITTADAERVRCRCRGDARRSFTSRRKPFGGSHERVCHGKAALISSRIHDASGAVSLSCNTRGDTAKEGTCLEQSVVCKRPPRYVPRRD